MSAPRYQLLASKFRKAIASGQYAVGDHLPTEIEICQQHNVSRFTAREAMRILRESGLVERRRGVGTIVIATNSVPAFEQALGSVDDLLQYAQDARLSVLTYEKKSHAAAPLADADLGQAYVEVTGLRRASKRAKAIGYARIYIRAEVAPSRKEMEALASAITSRIEQSSGLRITRIEQTIAARPLSEREAEALGAEIGMSALVIRRSYFDDSGRLVVLSDTAHPAGRFVYQQTIRRAGD
jgi:DNA-binding GntR family transcriptional regulator